MRPPGRVIIVGAGEAGLGAARALRREGFEGEILVLGAGESPADARGVRMRKALSDAEPVSQPQMAAPTDVALSRGRSVIRINRRQKCVELSDGTSEAYDHLILATGARPRRVPGMDEGNYVLGSGFDALRLRSALLDAQSVTVIGGGFLGLEVAALARARGCDVTVLECKSHLMAGEVSPLSARGARRALEAAGVQFRLNRFARRTQPSSGGSLTVLDDGTEIHADLSVACIGVAPRVDLTLECGLAGVEGIEVDDRLLTPDVGISAIGACAVLLRPGGRRWLARSNEDAAGQAAYVARRLMGDASPFAGVPSLKSMLGSLTLEIAGDAISGDRAVVRGDPEGQEYSVFRYRGAQLVGVESLNRPADHRAALLLLGQAVSPRPTEVADLDCDLTALADRAFDTA